jgi:quinol monooxygenase YgiN
MPLASITRLRVRSWRYLLLFFLQALRSARQAAAAEGNLTTRVLRDRRNTFWTGTVWANDAAMKSFMLSGVHRQAMRKLPDWCDEAAVVHWTQEGNELPT